MSEKDFQSKLCKRIIQTRDIKESSCKTYLLALKKIKKKIDNDDNLTSTRFLNNFDKVMNVINDENKITSKKNKLTAVIVALSSDKNKDNKLIDKYSNELKNLSNKYTAFLKTQEKTETQKKNWINYDDLIDVINKVMNEVKKKNIKNKDKLTDKEFDLLQQYLILRTYIDYPLRNDFADMKILTVDELKKIPIKERNNNNYLVLFDNKKEFYINQFKNQKFIGNKRLNINPKLDKIINLWLKFNKSGWYLVKKDKTSPMTPNMITKFLNRIFLKNSGKKISTSMIRHIIISHDLKDRKTIKEQEEEKARIENKYFHSKNINELYRKI